VVPSPTPTLFGNVFDPVQARAQIANLRTAIANGLGIGQLAQGDAISLGRQVDEVAGNLNNNRPQLAATAADELLLLIGRMVIEGRVPANGELQNAAVALRSALPSRR
jgi:hypothetical protein